jgi:hypothetical protein
MTLSSILKGSVSLSAILVLLFVTFTNDYFKFQYVIFTEVLTLVVVSLSLFKNIFQRIARDSLLLSFFLLFILSLYVFARSPITNVPKLIQDYSICSLILFSYYIISYLFVLLKEDFDRSERKKIIFASTLIAGISILIMYSLYHLFRIPF